MSAGSTSIVATVEGISGSALVVVQSSPVPAPVSEVRSVIVTVPRTSLLVRDTIRATAIAQDAYGNVIGDRIISWTSSDSTIATIHADGLVLGMRAGTAAIIATVDGIVGQVTIAVADSSIAPPPAPPPPPPSTFQAPNILGGASFETGWDGFVNWSFALPTGVTRDATRALDGGTSVRKVLPVTSGSDIGSQFVFPLRQGFDRVWSRFYFYLDAPVNGIVKFNIWFDDVYNTQFGGLYLEGGNLSLFIAPEAYTFTRLRSLSGLTNGWHSVEVDYWRNGDTSNGGNDYPSIAVWLDGQQITSGIGNPPGTAVWLNGRLNLGARRSTARLGIDELLGLINGTPNNTIPGNIWVDKVAISTAGRIGP